MNVTSFVYDAGALLPSGSPSVATAAALDDGVTADLPAPSRAPLAEDEMTSLLQLLQRLQTSLLWHCCDWAELGRNGQLPAADLQAKAQALFVAWQQRLVRHVQDCLESAPTVGLDAPAAAP